MIEPIDDDEKRALLAELMVERFGPPPYREVGLSLLRVPDDPPHVFAGVAGDRNDVDLPDARRVRLDDLPCEVFASLLDNGLSALVRRRCSVQGCRHTVIVADPLPAIQEWPPRSGARCDIN